MATTVREWNIEQRLLPPPAAAAMMDFVGADHVASFVRDTVREQLYVEDLRVLAE